jgi:hypothetical protein
MSLVQAIDAAIAFVRAHPDKMTRIEVKEFKRLAGEVYVLAYQAGLHHALPQVPAMQPQLEAQSPPLPPAQFESKLNLPGDWWSPRDDELTLPIPRWQDEPDEVENCHVFMVCPAPRWFQDMDELRRLALAGAKHGPQAEGSAQPAGPVEAMTWQNAAERMERLRAQGEPWTSMHELARQIGCSSFTIKKAVDKTPKLRTWAKLEADPRAQQGLSVLVLDKAVQPREPDPADDAADAELRRLFDDAGPDERAILNEMQGASREFQLWYIEQTKKTRERCRKRWKKLVETDPGIKTWFLAQAGKEQVAFFNDPYPGDHTPPRP